MASPVIYRGRYPLRFESVYTASEEMKKAFGYSHHGRTNDGRVYGLSSDGTGKLPKPGDHASTSVHTQYGASYLYQSRKRFSKDTEADFLASLSNLPENQKIADRLNMEARARAEEQSALFKEAQAAKADKEAGKLDSVATVYTSVEEADAAHFGVIEPETLADADILADRIRTAQDQGYTVERWDDSHGEAPSLFFYVRPNGDVDSEKWRTEERAWQAAADDAALGDFAHMAESDDCEHWNDGSDRCVRCGVDLNAPSSEEPASLLERCEAFIAGFEDDDTQEGVTGLLTALRAAIQAQPVTVAPHVTSEVISDEERDLITLALCTASDRWSGFARDLDAGSVGANRILRDMRASFIRQSESAKALSRRITAADRVSLISLDGEG